MKRLLMVMAALIACVTVTVAQSDEVPFKVELSQLDSYLKLKPYQKKKVKVFTENFIEMQKTCEAKDASGKEIQKILADNLTEMKGTLSKAQFEKYIVLLNITNKNKNVMDENLFAELVKQVDDK